MVQVSKPRSAKYSIAEESGRPGTYRSNVGCDAIDEPCTKKIVPRFCTPAGGFLFQRKSLISPFFVQCSVPPVQLVVERSAMLCCPFSNAERRRLKALQCKLSAD